MHIFRDPQILFVHLAIRRFNESELVDTGKSGQRTDETDVRTFRGFNRAHAAIVGVMNVPNFESGPLAAQAAWAQRAETPLVRQFGQGVGLIHKLRQLARPEKFFDRRHNRPNVDQGLRRNHIHILDCHPFPNHAFHPGQSNAELVLQQFSHGTQPTVTQMVNVIFVAKALRQIQQIADGSNNVGLRHRPTAKISRRRGAKQFFRVSVFVQAGIDFDQALADRLFTEYTALFDNIEDFIIDTNRIAMLVTTGHHNFAGGFIDDILLQIDSLQPTTPAKLLREFVTAHCRQIIAFGIKEQGFHKLGGIFDRRRLARTQSLVNFEQRRITIRRIVLSCFQCSPNSQIFVKQRQNQLVGFPAQSTDQYSHRQFAGAVDPHGNHVIGIRLQFKPSAPVRNDRGKIKLLAIGVHRNIIVNAG